MSKSAHPALPLRVSPAPALRFRLLGPLEVLAAGKVTVLHRERQRTLLALLLVRAGEFVSTDWLIDDLWDGRPPETARASLQNSICQLRKALGTPALLTRPDGYALDAEPEETDFGRFRRILTDARAAATPRSRGRKLRDALALWRGPALADVTKTPSLEFEVSLLNDLRVSALEGAIDAELELGRGADLVPELERLIASEPYRERLRAQLMIALYRAGCQSRALEVFKETHETLVSELGLDPSPALHELERAILNHDPALAARRLLRGSAAREKPKAARSASWHRSNTAPHQ
jgi:DNA-binding SARP family transcriptional activator